jgi:hypothetical protein
MTSEEVLLEKIKVLPPDLKQKAIEYVEALQKKAQKKIPRVSLEGIWADMDVNITEEDIREVRREMWKNFPREQFFEKEADK